mgnify:CR=1 FL=1
MSDTGNRAKLKNIPRLRGHKITPYEGGIRVPMLVKVPGNDEGGVGL